MRSTFGFKKFVATLTALFFSWESAVGYALPAANIPSTSAKHVLLILNAHTSSDAQKSIAELLASLQAEGVDLIGLEGAGERIDGSAFRNFPVKAALAKAAWRFVKEGIFTGAEYFYITATELPKFFGLEDRAVYFEDRRAFVETIEKAEESSPVLADLQNKISESKKKIYSKALFEFDRLLSRFAQDEISFLNYFEGTVLASKNAQIALPNYPNVYALSKALEEEKRISLEELSKEIQKIEVPSEIKKLILNEGPPPKSTDEVLENYQKIRIFFSSLIEQNKIDLSQHKHFSRYWSWLGRVVQVDSRALFDELSALQGQAFGRLAKTEGEKELVRFSERFELLKKLVRLELTQKEWKNISAQEPMFREVEESARRFYAFAEKRNEIFAERIIQNMKRHKKNVSAVVIGGFHEEGLRDLLVKKGVSVQTVSPKIENALSDIPYLDRMMGKPPQIEAVLEEDFSVSAISQALPIGDLVSNDERNRTALGLKTLASHFAGTQPLHREILRRAQRDSVSRLFRFTHNDVLARFAFASFAGLTFSVFAGRAEARVSTPLSEKTLRSAKSIDRGIQWKRNNEYIFGGGFGYDIRINDAVSKWSAVAKFFYAMGRTWGGSKYLNHQGKALITGDHRITSNAFRFALVQGLLDEGIEVVTQPVAEVITTGLPSRKGLAEDFDLIIQITGSHNPKEGNGAKMTFRGLPFFGSQLLELSRAIDRREGWSPRIRRSKYEVAPHLITEHVEALDRVMPDLKHPPSLIVDFRGGAAGSVFTRLAAAKGYHLVFLRSAEDGLSDAVFEPTGKPVLIAINDKPSPEMKAGIWDPSKPEAFDGIQRLQTRILSDPRFQGRNYAGVVFDGDGDRSGFLAERGPDETKSRLLMPERMLIAFYQNMVLENEAGVRVLNRLGHTVKLALDVRSSKVIIDVLKGIARGKNLKLEGEFIAAGFPNHRAFVLDELTAVQNVLSAHPRLSSEDRAAVEKLMAEYTSAEASGHFFFNVLDRQKFLEKKIVVDDGVTSSILFLHLADIGGLTIGGIDAQFPRLPVTNETRLEKAPADVAKKQELAEKIVKVFAENNPELIPMPVAELTAQIESARDNPPKRQDWNDVLLLVDGIRLELTNGVWILFRKSNTSAVIVFKAEADSEDKHPALVDTMKRLQKAIDAVKSSDSAFTPLVVEKFNHELEQSEARSEARSHTITAQEIQNWNIRYAAFDFDGNLAHAGEVPTKEMFHALNRLARLGVHVDIVSSGANGYLTGLMVGEERLDLSLGKQFAFAGEAGGAILRFNPETYRFEEDPAASLRINEHDREIIAELFKKQLARIGITPAMINVNDNRREEFNLRLKSAGVTLRAGTPESYEIIKPLFPEVNRIIRMGHLGLEDKFYISLSNVAIDATLSRKEDWVRRRMDELRIHPEEALVSGDSAYEGGGDHGMFLIHGARKLYSGKHRHDVPHDTFYTVSEGPEGLVRALEQLADSLEAKNAGRSEARTKGLKHFLMEGWVMANHKLVSFHAAFFTGLIQTVFEWMRDQTEISLGVVTTFLASEVTISLLLAFLTWHTVIAVHEMGHFFTAKKKDLVIGLEVDLEKEVKIPFREYLEAFLKIPYGKFKGVIKEHGNYYVDTKMPNLAVAAAGPIWGQRLSRFTLFPGLALFVTAIILHPPIIAPLMLILGRLMLGMGVVSYLDITRTDNDAYRKYQAEKSKPIQEVVAQIQAEAMESTPGSFKEFFINNRMTESVVNVNGEELLLPWQFRNTIQGGRHVEKQGGNVSFQEFMLLPVAPDLVTATAWVNQIQDRVVWIMRNAEPDKGLKFVGNGIEGGVVGTFKGYEEQVLDVLMQAVSDVKVDDGKGGKRSLVPGKDVFFALDPAMSELANAYVADTNTERVGYYKFWMRTDQKVMTSAELVDYLESLVNRYPIASIEDGMAENDWEGWKLLKQRLGKRVLIVGDDLVTTNEDIIRKANEEEVIDSVLIKANQIGTLSETILAVLEAWKWGNYLIISHRSKSGPDDFETSLALAWKALGAKFGGAKNAERQLKWNKFLEEFDLADRKVTTPPLSSDVKIVDFVARQIPTNEGQPTVEVSVILSNGSEFKASVPIGSSAGSNEAVHLIDGGIAYDGKGNLNAVKNVNELIAPLFLEKTLGELGDLEDIDAQLLSLERRGLLEKGLMDGKTSREEQKKALQRKALMGMNALLPVSIAMGKILAAREGLRFWEYVRRATNQGVHRDYLYNFSAKPESELVRHRAEARSVSFYFPENITSDLQRQLGQKAVFLAEFIQYLRKFHMPVSVPKFFAIPHAKALELIQETTPFSRSTLFGLRRALARIGKNARERYGSRANPLFISLRASPVRFSPGQYLTVLNLGINDETLPGLAKRLGSEELAKSVYVKLINDFLMDIHGFSEEQIVREIGKIKVEAGESVQTNLLNAHKAVYQNLVHEPFPQDVFLQMRMVLQAIYTASPRYTTFASGQFTGGAVVERMVFGVGENSFAGEVLSRNPETGTRIMMGNIEADVQGDETTGLTRLDADFFRKYPQLSAYLNQILTYGEQFLQDAVRLEITIEKGTLYLLQIRRAERTHEAQAALIMDLLYKHIISERQARKRAKPVDVAALQKRSRIANKPDLVKIAEGILVAPGVAVGHPVISEKGIAEARAKGIPYILVKPEIRAHDKEAIDRSNGVVSLEQVGNHAESLALAAHVPSVLRVDYQSVDFDAGKIVLIANGSALELDERDFDQYLTIDSDGTVYFGKGEIVTEPHQPSEEIAQFIDWKQKWEGGALKKTPSIDVPLYISDETIEQAVRQVFAAEPKSVDAFAFQLWENYRNLDEMEYGGSVPSGVVFANAEEAGAKYIRGVFERSPEQVIEAMFFDPETRPVPHKAWRVAFKHKVVKGLNGEVREKFFRLAIEKSMQIGGHGINNFILAQVLGETIKVDSPFMEGFFAQLNLEARGWFLEALYELYERRRLKQRTQDPDLPSPEEMVNFLYRAAGAVNFDFTIRPEKKLRWMNQKSREVWEERPEVKEKILEWIEARRSEARAPLKILFADKPGKMDLGAFEAAYPGQIQVVGEIGIGKKPDELLRLIREEKPDIVFIRSTTKVFNKPGKENFLQLLGGKVILRGGTDTDNVDLDAAREAGVIVARTGGAENSVANLFFRFLLYYFRTISSHGIHSGSKDDLSNHEGWNEVFDLSPDQFRAALQKSKEDGRGEITKVAAHLLFLPTFPFPDGLVLQNSTIGLFGSGRIPRVIERKLRRLSELAGERGEHPQLIMWSRSMDPALKERILDEANVISIHLPGSAAEHGPILGKAELERLGRRATRHDPIAIFNTSRKVHVDHGALREALKQNEHLFYFGDLDFDEELTALMRDFSKQVFLTPHIGASTPDAVQWVEDGTLSALKEFFDVHTQAKTFSKAAVSYVVPPASGYLYFARAEAREIKTLLLISKSQWAHLVFKSSMVIALPGIQTLTASNVNEAREQLKKVDAVLSDHEQASTVIKTIDSLGLNGLPVFVRNAPPGRSLASVKEEFSHRVVEVYYQDRQFNQMISDLKHGFNGRSEARDLKEAILTQGEKPQEAVMLELNQVLGERLVVDLERVLERGIYGEYNPFKHQVLLGVQRKVGKSNSIFHISIPALKDHPHASNDLTALKHLLERRLPEYKVSGPTEIDNDGFKFFTLELTLKLTHRAEARSIENYEKALKQAGDLDPVDKASRDRARELANALKDAAGRQTLKVDKEKWKELRDKKRSGLKDVFQPDLDEGAIYYVTDFLKVKHVRTHPPLIVFSGFDEKNLALNFKSAYKGNSDLPVMPLGEFVDAVQKGLVIHLEVPEKGDTSFELASKDPADPGAGDSGLQFLTDIGFGDPQQASRPAKSQPVKALAQSSISKPSVFVPSIVQHALDAAGPGALFTREQAAALAKRWEKSRGKKPPFSVEQIIKFFTEHGRFDDGTKNQKSKGARSEARAVGVNLLMPTKQISGKVPKVNGIPRLVNKHSLRTKEKIDKVLTSRPVLIGYLRGGDIGGSSLDLLGFQRLLNEPGATRLDEMTSTTVLTSSFPVRLTLERADDPNVIEYVVEPKHIVHRVHRDEFKLVDGKTPNGQLDAFAYIMGLFNIWGIKGTFETLEPLAEAGGLGRSSGSNALFLRAASDLSGANLSDADIQAESVFIENEVLGGFTGGQESAATILGGVHQLYWMGYVPDAAGHLRYPYSALAVGLFDPDADLDEIASHIVFVQPGLEYVNGKPQDTRTAWLINTMWTHLLEDRDSVGVRLHTEKIKLANQAAEGLRTGQWNLVVSALNRHREIRDALQRRWFELALMSPDEQRAHRVDYARKYTEMLGEDSVLAKYFEQYGLQLKEKSLYSLTAQEFIGQLEAKIGKKITDPNFPIGVFLPGAGGPGTTVMLVAEDGKWLNQMLEELGYPEFNDRNEVIKITSGTGVLKGRIGLKIGKPIQRERWPETVSSPAVTLAVYDQDTGMIHLAEERPALDRLSGIIQPARSKPDLVDQFRKERAGLSRQTSQRLGRLRLQLMQDFQNLSPKERIDILRALVEEAYFYYEQHDPQPLMHWVAVRDFVGWATGHAPIKNPQTVPQLIEETLAHLAAQSDGAEVIGKMEEVFAWLVGLTSAAVAWKLRTAELQKVLDMIRRSEARGKPRPNTGVLISETIFSVRTARRLTTDGFVSLGDLTHYSPDEIAGSYGDLVLTEVKQVLRAHGLSLRKSGPKARGLTAHVSGLPVQIGVTARSKNRIRMFVSHLEEEEGKTKYHIPRFQTFDRILRAPLAGSFDLTGFAESIRDKLIPGKVHADAVRVEDLREAIRTSILEFNVRSEARHVRMSLKKIEEQLKPFVGKDVSLLLTVAANPSFEDSVKGKRRDYRVIKTKKILKVEHSYEKYEKPVYPISGWFRGSYQRGRQSGGHRITVTLLEEYGRRSEIVFGIGTRPDRYLYSLYHIKEELPSDLEIAEEAVRRHIVGGNWKMAVNTKAEAIKLLTEIATLLNTEDMKDVDVVAAPSFIHLHPVKDALDELISGGKIAEGRILLGAQDMSAYEPGAWTSQTSYAQLKDAGVSVVILGHSERRRGDEKKPLDERLTESSKVVNGKVKQALAQGLIPIVAVGENQSEREGKETFRVIKQQIRESLEDLTVEQMKNVVLAYEPVWAIGTGLSATPGQADEIQRFIRELLLDMFGYETAAQTRIQYGGSVKPANASELIAQPNIDGGLIGGAALKAEDFVAIIRAMAQARSEARNTSIETIRENLDLLAEKVGEDHNIAKPDFLTAVALREDGLLAVGTKNRQIRANETHLRMLPPVIYLYQVKDFEQLDLAAVHTIQGFEPTQIITQLEFAPKQPDVLVSLSDKTLKFWRIERAWNQWAVALISSTHGVTHKPFHSFRFNSAGTHVELVNGDGRTVQKISIPRAEARNKKPHDEVVTADTRLRQGDTLVYKKGIKYSIGNILTLDGQETIILQAPHSRRRNVRWPFPGEYRSGVVPRANMNTGDWTVRRSEAREIELDAGKFKRILESLEIPRQQNIRVHFYPGKIEVFEVKDGRQVRNIGENHYTNPELSRLLSYFGGVISIDSAAESPLSLDDFYWVVHKVLSTGFNPVAVKEKLVNALSERGFTLQFIDEHSTDADLPYDSVQVLIARSEARGKKDKNRENLRSFISQFQGIQDHPDMPIEELMMQYSAPVVTAARPLWRRPTQTIRLFENELRAGGILREYDPEVVSIAISMMFLVLFTQAVADEERSDPGVITTAFRDDMADSAQLAINLLNHEFIRRATNENTVDFRNFVRTTLREVYGLRSEVRSFEFKIAHTKIQIMEKSLQETEADAVAVGVNTSMLVGGGTTDVVMNAIRTAKGFRGSPIGAQEIAFPPKEGVRAGTSASTKRLGQAVISDSLEKHGIDTKGHWKYVISTMIHDLNSNASREDIEKATFAALKLADETRLKSIAFPAMGTGVLEVTVAQSAEWMLSAVQKFLNENPATHLKVIKFVLINQSKFVEFAGVARRVARAEVSRSEARAYEFDPAKRGQVNVLLVGNSRSVRSYQVGFEVLGYNTRFYPDFKSIKTNDFSPHILVVDTASFKPTNAPVMAEFLRKLDRRSAKIIVEAEPLGEDVQPQEIIKEEFESEAIPEKFPQFRRSEARVENGIAKTQLQILGELNEIYIGRGEIPAALTRLEAVLRSGSDEEAKRLITGLKVGEKSSLVHEYLDGLYGTLDEARSEARDSEEGKTYGELTPEERRLLVDGLGEFVKANENKPAVVRAIELLTIVRQRLEEDEDLAEIFELIGQSRSEAREVPRPEIQINSETYVIKGRTPQVPIKVLVAFSSRGQLEFHMVGGHKYFTLLQIADQIGKAIEKSFERIGILQGAKVHVQFVGGTKDLTTRLKSQEPFDLLYVSNILVRGQILKDVINYQRNHPGTVFSAVSGYQFFPVGPIQDMVSKLSSRSEVRTVNVAHRARGVGFVENTYEAFQKAIELGFPEIELDIRYTKDGKMVVFHDINLTRLTNGKDKRKINEVAWDELKTIELYQANVPTGHVPLIEDVLGLVQGKNVKVQIEIKDGIGISEQIVSLVREKKLTNQVFFISFLPHFLNEVRAIDPNLQTILVAMPQDKNIYPQHTLDDEEVHYPNTWTIDELIAYAKQHGYAGIDYHMSDITPENMAKMRAADLSVFSYGIKDENQGDMRRAIALGVDRLATDWPSTLQNLLNQDEKLVVHYHRHARSEARSSSDPETIIADAIRILKTSGLSWKQYEVAIADILNLSQSDDLKSQSLALHAFQELDRYFKGVFADPNSDRDVFTSAINVFEQMVVLEVEFFINLDMLKSISQLLRHKNTERFIPSTIEDILIRAAYQIKDESSLIEILKDLKTTLETSNLRQEVYAASARVLAAIGRKNDQFRINVANIFEEILKNPNSNKRVHSVVLRAILPDITSTKRTSDDFVKMLANVFGFAFISGDKNILANLSHALAQNTHHDSYLHSLIFSYAVEYFIENRSEARQMDNDTLKEGLIEVANTPRPTYVLKDSLYSLLEVSLPEKESFAQAWPPRGHFHYEDYLRRLDALLILGVSHLYASPLDRWLPGSRRLAQLLHKGDVILLKSSAVLELADSPGLLEAAIWEEKLHLASIQFDQTQWERIKKILLRSRHPAVNKIRALVKKAYGHRDPMEILARILMYAVGEKYLPDETINKVFPQDLVPILMKMRDEEWPSKLEVQNIQAAAASLQGMSGERAYRDLIREWVKGKELPSEDQTLLRETLATIKQKGETAVKNILHSRRSEARNSGKEIIAEVDTVKNAVARLFSDGVDEVFHDLMGTSDFLKTHFGEPSYARLEAALEAMKGRILQQHNYNLDTAHQAASAVIDEASYLKTVDEIIKYFNRSPGKLKGTKVSEKQPDFVEKASVALILLFQDNETLQEVPAVRTLAKSSGVSRPSLNLHFQPVLGAVKAKINAPGFNSALRARIKSAIQRYEARSEARLPLLRIDDQTVEQGAQRSQLRTAKTGVLRLTVDQIESLNDPADLETQQTFRFILRLIQAGHHIQIIVPSAEWAPKLRTKLYDFQRAKKIELPSSTQIDVRSFESNVPQNEIKKLVNQELYFVTDMAEASVLAPSLTGGSIIVTDRVMKNGAVDQNKITALQAVELLTAALLGENVFYNQSKGYRNIFFAEQSFLDSALERLSSFLQGKELLLSAA